MTVVDFSAWPRIMMGVCVLAVIAFSAYGVAKLLCQLSLRDCSYEQACGGGSICVTYGIDSKCVPQSCASVNAYLANVEGQWAKGIHSISSVASGFTRWMGNLLQG